MLKLNNPEKNLITKYIQEHHLDNHMIFITGIGKIYPIVRAQDILNNLDINNVPLVLSILVSILVMIYCFLMK